MVVKIYRIFYCGSENSISELLSELSKPKPEKIKKYPEWGDKKLKQADIDFEYLVYRPFESYSFKLK